MTITSSSPGGTGRTPRRCGPFSAKPAAYVGMIGSRPKIEVMRGEFLGKGWATADEWARVHAPIGLDIGSKTVDEIAVSIAAELVSVRSKLKEAERR